MNFYRRLKASYRFMIDLFNFSEFETLSSSQSDFKLPPSFVKKIKIAEYDPKHSLFWLSDAKTPVAMYELTGIATEGSDEKMMKDYEQRIFEIMSLFPQHSEKAGTWNVQMYAKDEDDFSEVYKRVEDSVSQELKNTKLTQLYLKLLKKHFEYMSRPEGVYDDNNLTRFKGKSRKLRLVFYRINPKATQQTSIREINTLRKKIETSLRLLRPYGMKFKRIDEKSYFSWMIQKFHLNINGKRVTDYLEKRPYLGLSERPYGYDIIEKALAFPIESNKSEGWWKIGDTYHKYISCLGLIEKPKIGSISAEREIAKVRQAWMDSLPYGSEFYLGFNPISKHSTKNKADKNIKKARASTSDDRDKMIQEGLSIKKELVNKNYPYPVQAGCFIAATSLEELEEKENSLDFDGTSYEKLKEQYDVDRLDKFTRFLPGNYHPSIDKKYSTSKLTYVRDIARLAPIGYGRASGADKPLFIRYNRNGEPIFINPLKDRTNNAHGSMMGTSGGGKSVDLADKLFSLMALERPYLLLIDAGHSFKFIMQFFKLFNFSVKETEIEMLSDGELPEHSLNPYADTAACIKQIKDLNKLSIRLHKSIKELKDETLKLAEGNFKNYKKNSKKSIQEQFKSAKAKAEKDVFSNATEARDLQAEFLTSSLIIATGGRDLIDVGFTDHHKRDLMDITDELLLEIDDEGLNRQLLPSDILRRLEEVVERDITSTNELKRLKALRCNDIAAGFKTFLKSSLNRTYFDTPAQPPENYDIKYFEFGPWKNDLKEYNAPRALAISNLVYQEITLAQQRKKNTKINKSRLTYIIIDEYHVIARINLTQAPIVQTAKVGRKEGIVLLLASQDPKDFSGAAEKLLSNFENLELLYFKDKNELEDISKKLGLLDRDIDIASNIRNLKGCHSESYYTTAKYNVLTRNFPFREILYLSANELEEFEARDNKSVEHNCSDVEAAFIQAQEARGEKPNLQEIRELLGTAA